MRPLLAPALLLACVAPLFAQPKFEFKEAKHSNGSVKYIDGIPVVTVAGKPAEIGEQLGELVVKNTTDPVAVMEQFLADNKLKGTLPLLKIQAARLKAGIPADHLAEMEALAKASKQDLNLLITANTIYDLSSGMGCSTLIAEKGRSATGGVLFGRLFDWTPTKGLCERTAVVVVKAEKKRAFAMITITPITGVVSGMNDAGLSVTINEIRLSESKDKAAFNWEGVPTLHAFRRVLEECGTVAEAEKLLNGMKRTTSACMTVADAEGGAVFEITPKSVQKREANKGVCCCCNDFRTDALATKAAPCVRLEKLLKSEADADKLSVADVFDRLDKVNQGKKTLQAMVFEPGKKVLHLKVGDATESATKVKAVKLDIGELVK
jgi:isopenicillin-N N-acyltransferase-like protein